MFFFVFLVDPKDWDMALRWNSPSLTPLTVVVFFMQAIHWKRETRARLGIFLYSNKMPKCQTPARYKRLLDVVWLTRFVEVKPRSVVCLQESHFRRSILLSVLLVPLFHEQNINYNG